ncbi:MAG: sigma-70 family RNA polymerase sigma factor [Saprospiraceae bacterium]
MLRSEELLVQDLIKGDQGAFSELYDGFGESLYSIINKIIPDPSECENLLQDTFVKIWRSIHLYNPEKGRLYTWLISVARNIAIDFYRSSHFSNLKMIQNEDSLVYSVEHAPEMLQLDNIGFSEELKVLEDDHRKLIDLQYYLGYTQQEVSDLLKIPLGTVKSRTRSALLILRKHFSKNEYGY